MNVVFLLSLACPNICTVNTGSLAQTYSENMFVQVRNVTSVYAKSTIHVVSVNGRVFNATKVSSVN